MHEWETMTKFPSRNWKLCSLRNLKRTSGIYSVKTMTAKIFMNAKYYVPLFMCYPVNLKCMIAQWVINNKAKEKVRYEFKIKKRTDIIWNTQDNQLILCYKCHQYCLDSWIWCHHLTSQHEHHQPDWSWPATFHLQRLKLEEVWEEWKKHSWQQAGNK